MIQETELRIGNWVMMNWSRQPRQVDMVLLKDFHDEIIPDGISPIELTEEILLKAGFERVDHIHGYSFFTSKTRKNKGLPVIDIYESRTEVMSYSVSHCKYVHQLQNLYFALTGTELTLNL